VDVPAWKIVPPNSEDAISINDYATRVVILNSNTLRKQVRPPERTLTASVGLSEMD